MRRRATMIALACCIAAIPSCMSAWLYFPTREIRHTPEEKGLVYDTVYFQSAGGRKIHAWWVPSGAARATILLCHGNGGNISHRIGQIETLQKQGFNVFIFDYAGYGLSDGSPTEQGLYDDAAHAWGFVTEDKKINPSSVIIWGTSLGGAVAARLASTSTPRALVLESAFYSLAEVVHHHVPIYPHRLCLDGAFETHSFLKKVQSPVLVIHSRDDETVPYDQGRRLYEAALQPKQFLEIRGSHNNGFYDSSERICDGLDTFLMSAR